MNHVLAHVTKIISIIKLQDEKGENVFHFSGNENNSISETVSSYIRHRMKFAYP